MGIGIVLRNSKGEAKIVLSAPKAHVYYAFATECYALVRSMQLCHELELHQVVFEGDSKVVIDCVNVPYADCSWKGPLIDDI